LNWRSGGGGLGPYGFVDSPLDPGLLLLLLALLVLGRPLDPGFFFFLLATSVLDLLLDLIVALCLCCHLPLHLVPGRGARRPDHEGGAEDWTSSSAKHGGR
jgi:hypothetical protein